MDAHHRPDLADDDLRAGHLRLQRRHEFVDVVRTGMQHADRFDVVGRDPVEDEVQGLRTGPDLAGLLHGAIHHCDDRLDGQHGTEQCLRAADAPAPLEVFERVERRVQALTLAPFGDLARDRRDVGALGGAAGGVQRQDADAHRRARGVDDLDRAQTVDRLRRDLRGLHRGRERGRQVDADDAVGARVVQAPEGLFEGADRWRRGLREYR